MNKKHNYIPPSVLKIAFSVPGDGFNEHYKGEAYGTLGHNYSKTIYPNGTITEWKDGKKIR